MFFGNKIVDHVNLFLTECPTVNLPYCCFAN